LEIGRERRSNEEESGMIWDMERNLKKWEGMEAMVFGDGIFGV
jgi:hypothetical protein